MMCIGACRRQKRSSRCKLVVFMVSMVIVVMTISNYAINPCCVTSECFSDHSTLGYHATRTSSRDGIYDNASETRTMYQVPGRGIFFYNGYYDNRQESGYIRLFGIHRNDTTLSDFMCEWNSSQGITWQVTAHGEQVDNDWPLHNKYFAFMMTCVLPRNVPDTPRHVDVVQRGASVLPSTVGRVRVPVRHFRSMYPTRSKLGVCVKPMTGQFAVSRVVEWVELNLAAGYTHFVMYDTDLQGASRFVMDYYISMGIVTVIRFPFLSSMLELAERQVSLNGELRYALYQQVYLMALHDCIYRFGPSFEYLTMIDIDEVLIPANNITITDVIKMAETNIPDVASYMFYTTWHYQEFTTEQSDIPEFLYMQKYAKSPTETVDQPKSIIHSDRVLTVNWHGVLECLNTTQIARYLLGAWDYACVHHYRSGTCKDSFKKLCHNMTSSASVRKEITRYRHVTERNVLKVLDHINIK